MVTLLIPLIKTNQTDFPLPDLLGSGADHGPQCCLKHQNRFILFTGLRLFPTKMSFNTSSFSSLFKGSGLNSLQPLSPFLPMEKDQTNKRATEIKGYRREMLVVFFLSSESHFPQQKPIPPPCHDLREKGRAYPEYPCQNCLQPTTQGRRRERRKKEGRRNRGRRRRHQAKGEKGKKGKEGKPRFAQWLHQSPDPSSSPQPRASACSASPHLPITTQGDLVRAWSERWSQGTGLATLMPEFRLRVHDFLWFILLLAFLTGPVSLCLKWG